MQCIAELQAVAGRASLVSCCLDCASRSVFFDFERCFVEVVADRAVDAHLENHVLLRLL